MEMIRSLEGIEHVSNRFINFEGREYQKQICLPNHKLYYSQSEQHALEFKRNNAGEKQIKAYYSIENPAEKC